MSEKFSKPKILPPLWMLMSVIAQFALDRWLPVAEWIGSPHNWLGGALALPGFAAILWAAGSFRKADTGIVPFTESTALVTSGLYRITRNPMYLGIVAMTLGVAMSFGTVPFYLAAALLFAVLNFAFCPYEEQRLRTAFPDFDAYAARVRRWI